VGFITRIDGVRPSSVCFTAQIVGSCGPEKLREDGGPGHLARLFGLGAGLRIYGYMAK
jgi:hypothetical protein